MDIRITSKLDKLSANSKRNSRRKYAEQETSGRINRDAPPCRVWDITSRNLNNSAKKIVLTT